MLGNPLVLLETMVEGSFALGEERQLLVDSVGMEGIALLLYLRYGQLFGCDGLLGQLVGCGGLCKAVF